MSKREIIEENKFVRRVRRLGWITIKLTTAGPYGSRGYDDRIVLGPYRTTVLFEFKRKGKNAEPIQRYRHRKIAELGHVTHVVYTAKQAFKILWKEVQAQKISAKMHSVRSREARSRVSFGARPG